MTTTIPDAGNRADDAREEQKAEETYARLQQASAAFNEAAMESCSEIEALLAPYASARADESNAKARKDARGVRIKAHLEQCQEDGHRDGEHGLAATLQTAERLDFDVISMPEEMVVALAGMGALKVDVAVLRALKGKAAPVDDAWHFAMHGQTVSLLVKRDAP